MSTLFCCFPGCDKPAEWGILGEGQLPDMESHSCSWDLSKLLDSGYNTVWSLLGENESEEG